MINLEKYKNEPEFQTALKEMFSSLDESLSAKGRILAVYFRFCPQEVNILDVQRNTIRNYSWQNILIRRI